MARDARTNRLDPVTGWYEPEAARLARLMRGLGKIDLQDPSNWDLGLTLDEHKRAAEALEPVQGRPLLACSVGTKVQAKDWGAGQLAQRAGYVGCGAAAIRPGAGRSQRRSRGQRPSLRKRWAGRSVNLCGKLLPRQSAAVLARAKLFVGHDSGPMHLAAAVGTPCVAVFSARNKPRTWFPWGSQHEVVYHRTDCWGCDLETCIEQKKKCLTSILPAEVLGVVHRVLARLSLAHTLVPSPR